MARRRYISTVISRDKMVNRLAVEYGDFAALLYTWMVPHAADDTTLTSDPEEILYEVIPARRDKDVDDVQAALDGMLALGLIEHVGDDRIGFPVESFYRYQTYIKEDNRRKPTPDDDEPRSTAENAEEQRETPEKAVSVSPSFSVSLSPSHTEPRASRKAPEYGHDSTEYRLAHLLATRIRENNPKARAPTEARLQAWANTVRLMVERDGREPNEIRELLLWAQQHTFWFSVVLSMDKFREQFDQIAAQKIREQRQAEAPRGNGHDDRPPPPHMREFAPRPKRSAS